jgi:hypothetical protein
MRPSVGTTSCSTEGRNVYTCPAGARPSRRQRRALAMIFKWPSPPRKAGVALMGTTSSRRRAAAQSGVGISTVDGGRRCAGQDGRAQAEGDCGTAPGCCSGPGRKTSPCACPLRNNLRLITVLSGTSRSGSQFDSSAHSIEGLRLCRSLHYHQFPKCLHWRQLSPL